MGRYYSGKTVRHSHLRETNKGKSIVKTHLMGFRRGQSRGSSRATPENTITINNEKYNQRGFELMRMLENGLINPDNLKESEKEKILEAQRFTRYNLKGRKLPFDYEGRYIPKYDPNANPTIELKSKYMEWEAEGKP